MIDHTIGIEQRIARLERQNRRLKLAFMGTLGAALGAMLMGQAATTGSDVANIIRAHRIEVVSEEGKPAIVLGMTLDGTGTVNTLDAKENKVVTLGVTRTGDGSITTHNRRGNELIKLGVTTEGEGVVITHNSEGRKLLEMGVTVEGDPRIFTYKPDGAPKAQWPK